MEGSKGRIAADIKIVLIQKIDTMFYLLLLTCLVHFERRATRCYVAGWECRLMRREGDGGGLPKEVRPGMGHVFVVVEMTSPGIWIGLYVIPRVLRFSFVCTDGSQVYVRIDLTWALVG